MDEQSALPFSRALKLCYEPHITGCAEMAWLEQCPVKLYLLRVVVLAYPFMLLLESVMLCGYHTETPAVPLPLPFFFMCY